MPPNLSALVDALEQTWESVLGVCRDLTDELWALPTACPGWTVKDQVSHLAAIERTLQGRPQPEHAVPDYPWLRNDVGRFMEVAVDDRRPQPPDRVLAEFREVTAERLAALRSGPLDPAAEVIGPLGTPTAMGRMLPVRVFDSWTHEQDIREALGVPGGMTSPAATATRDWIVRSLPYVARQAALGLGEQVAIDVVGPTRAQATVTGTAERAGVTGGIEPGATCVVIGFREFTRLAAGRITAMEALADGGVEGDRDLAERFLTALAIAP